MTSVEEYLSSLPEDRQAPMRHLHEVLVAAVPHLTPRVWDYSGQLIGYGSYHYRTKSGSEGEWFPLGLASRKAYISLYATGVVDDEYLVERFRGEFPGTKTGRSCINITRPGNVDDDAVVRLALATAEWATTQEPSGGTAAAARPLG